MWLTARLMLAWLVVTAVIVAAARALPPGPQLAYLSIVPAKYITSLHVMDINRRIAAKIGPNLNVLPDGLKWSPDGQYIALVAVPNPQLLSIGVYVLRADGRDGHWLTAQNESCYNPAWSHDSQYLACGSSEGIYIFPRSQCLFAPAWLPDGKQLVFVSTPELPPFRQRVYRVDMKTGQPHLVFEAAQTVSRPAWSPDFQTMLLWADGPNASREIYSLNADGSGLRQLTVNHDLNSLPHWRPCWPVHCD
jgi:Tol biopolymer transport system component